MWTPSAQNTVYTQTSATPIVANGTADALLVDIPRVLIIDIADLDPGDQITVFATVSKGNCGTLDDGGSICIANVLAACATGAVPGTCYSMTIPYSTGMEDPDFWAGIAVSNQTNANGMYDMMFYDTGGNMATLVDQAIVPMGMNVMLASSIPSMTGFTQGAADLAAQMWFVTQTDFFGDVALFIGDIATTYLQGYQSVIMELPSCP
jgi:hypothetical protein